MTLEEELLALCKRASEEGKVVTVTQHPLPPLRMGHYYTCIATRNMCESSTHMIFLIDHEAYAEMPLRIDQLRLDV